MNKIPSGFKWIQPGIKAKNGRDIVNIVSLPRYQQLGMSLNYAWVGDIYNGAIIHQVLCSELSQIVNKPQKRKGCQRIPISAAKAISEKYGQSQVILVTWEGPCGLTHVVTYGDTLENCRQAAIGGNVVKKALGWPDEQCHDEPYRVRRKRMNVKKNSSEKKVL